MSFAESKGMWRLLTSGSRLINIMAPLGFSALIIALFLEPIAAILVLFFGVIMLTLSSSILLVSANRLCETPSFLIRPKLRGKIVGFLVSYAIVACALFTIASELAGFGALQYQTSIWAVIALVLFFTLCVKRDETIFWVYLLFICLATVNKVNSLAVVRSFIVEHHLALSILVLLASCIGIAHYLSKPIARSKTELLGFVKHFRNALNPLFSSPSAAVTRQRDISNMFILNSIQSWSSVGLLWVVYLCIFVAMTYSVSNQSQDTGTLLLLVFLVMTQLTQLLDHSVYRLKTIWLLSADSRAHLFKLWESAQLAKLKKHYLVSFLCWAAITVIYSLSFQITTLIYALSIVTSMSLIYMVSWFSTLGWRPLENSLCCIGINGVSIILLYLFYSQTMSELLPIWIVLTIIEGVTFRALLKKQMSSLDWMKVKSPPRLLRRTW